ncbi:tRNA synthetases class I-domain-containing protein [Lactarius psammicola]|nr:tRNA synthetases class I-domain-containing protein [Lactarius psammicola]
MSQAPATAIRFQAIFNAAVQSYQKQTRKDLLTHPLASQLRSCDSTSAIRAVLQDQITPAHDPNDYEVGVRHKLDFINILNDDDTFNTNVGPQFQGMKRFHARVEVIPICSKSGDVIEPVLKPQWWVNCKPLAEEAIKVVALQLIFRTILKASDLCSAPRAGELHIAPKQSEADWYRWLENIQDWCISRQLWWGHRCPAYFTTDGKWWVVGRNLEEATVRAKELAGSSVFKLEQDEDVLDTWFSSGLGPFSILGWPNKTVDFEKFYPTSMLETGWDILFFWVARMVMLGLRLTGEMPFKEILCHAMIRDAHGRKMSKSLGNVIDPLDVIQGLFVENLHEKLYEGNLDAAEIEKAKLGQKKDFPKGIPQCGTDALRFALCAYSGGGRDINLEILRVEGYRKFCNKIFNATKFAMLKLDESFIPEATPQPTGNETLVEKWILHKLNIATAETNKQLGERNFMAATNAVYNFWLYELCDVYIEAMKPMTDPTVSAETRISAQQTLYTCLDHGLRLLHPFMPFVTEELWQRLSRRPNDATPSIMVSKYPIYDTDFVFDDADKDFDLLFNAIRAGRSLAASYNIQSDIQISFHIQDGAEAALFESQKGVITTLTKGCNVHILVRGLVDLDAEIAKCEKKLQLARLNLDKVRKVEAQSDYVEAVPENVRLMNEDRRKTLEAEITSLESSKETFAKLK